ncbi:MAG: glycosyltransferase family 25 protein [Comamonas sp.]
MSENYCAYIINMDGSPARLQAVVTWLDAYGIAWSRVPAVDGRALDLLNHPDVSVQDYHRLHGKELNPAEVGCYLSHIRAFQQFLASENDYALILEDDAVFPHNPQAVLASLMAKPERWDVAKLSGYHSGCPVALDRLALGHVLCVPLTKYSGANAYLINRRAAQIYAERLLPMQLPYDHAFDRPWRYGIKFRMVLPVLCRPDESGTLPSTISGLRKNKLPWHQRFSVVAYRAGNELARVWYGLTAVIRHRLGLEADR